MKLIFEKLEAAIHQGRGHTATVKKMHIHGHLGPILLIIIKGGSKTRVGLINTKLLHAKNLS